jgi:hypothetical protein
MMGDPNQHSPPLKARHGSVLFYAGIAIALINMGLAWGVAIYSDESIGQPLLSVNGPDLTAREATALVAGAGAISHGPGDANHQILIPATNATVDPNVHIFAQQVVGLDVTLRVLSNRHILSMVAIGCSFTMMAIGFSLFVMGIQSAYAFKAGSDGNGTVALQATAPGLLCFVLATAIVISTMLHPTEITTGGPKVVTPLAEPASQPSADAKNSDQQLQEDIKQFQPHGGQ